MSYSILLLVALGIAAIGCLLRRRRLFWGNAIIGAGCLGLIGLIGWQVKRNLFAAEEKPPNRAHIVVSYFLANQVAADLAQRQGPVALLFPPESALSQAELDDYSSAFTRVLRGLPNPIQALRLDASRKEAASGLIPLEAFRQAVSKIPTAAAYVTFAGMPPDLPQLNAAEKPPFWYVFDPWASTNWVVALKEGRVRSVIVPRPGVDLSAAATIAGEPGIIFDQLYMLAKPDNAEQVAAKLRAD